MWEDHQREDISGKFGSVEIVDGKILPLLKAFVQLPPICQITVIPVASGTKRMRTKDLNADAPQLKNISNFDSESEKNVETKLVLYFSQTFFQQLKIENILTLTKVRLCVHRNQCVRQLPYIFQSLYQEPRVTSTASLHI